MNINARSIVNKVPLFLALLLSYSPDIIGITETWLYADIHDSQFTPPGYVTVRNDRLNQRGGGVALLFRSDFTFEVILSPEGIELLCCRLYYGKEHLNIWIFYRPHNNSWDILDDRGPASTAAKFIFLKLRPT